MAGSCGRVWLWGEFLLALTPASSITVPSAKWCGCSEPQIPVCEIGLLLLVQCCFESEAQCPADSTDSRSYTDPLAEGKVEGANVSVGSTESPHPAWSSPPRSTQQHISNTTHPSLLRCSKVSPSLGLGFSTMNAH